MRSNSINIKRKTKSIRDIDLYQTIHATELLQFLRVDFPKTVVTNAQEKTAQQHANTAAVKAAEAPVGVASIKSFFQGKPQSVIAATASISTDQDDAGDDGEGTDGGEAMVY